MLKMGLAVSVCIFIFAGGWDSIAGADSPGHLIWRGNYLTAATVGGSWSSIGTQAAQLSGFENGAEFPPEALNDFLNAHVDDSSSFLPVRWLAHALLRFMVFDPRENEIAPEDKEMLRAISEVSHRKYSLLKRAFVIPDSINRILTQSSKNQRFDGLIAACSSFVAFGPSTTTGERIMARNMDFPAVGSFDQSAAIYLIAPVDGFRMITVTMDGFPLAGISGMNEKGLALVLQDAYSTKLAREGASILSVNREVLEHATTIEEALAIYEKYQYTSGWLVHITDRDPGTHEGRSAIIEISGTGVNIKRTTGSFSVLSNSYQTPEQKKNELIISTGVEFHNRDRLNRLRQLVAKGPVDGPKSIDILRDSYSPYAGTGAVYTSSGIRAVDQVTSMVFFPDEGKIWVSDGLTPASYGTYYEFSFDQMTRGTPPRQVVSSIVVPEAVQEIVQAYKLDFQEIDRDAAYPHLLRAASLAGDCSFELLAGAAALHAGDMEIAREHLNKARECSLYNPHQKAITNLFLGFIQWDGGELTAAAGSIQEALKDENEIREIPDVKIDSQFLKVIGESLKKLASGHEADLKWISKLARLDIKTQDNLYGWH